jgi:hypothetical protein
MDLKDIAKEKLGSERADELSQDLQQLAEDLERIRSFRIELEDEP